MPDLWDSMVNDASETFTWAVEVKKLAHMNNSHHIQTLGTAILAGSQLYINVNHRP